MAQDRTPELMTKLSVFWYDRPERSVLLQSVAYNPQMYRLADSGAVLGKLTAKAWARRGWVQIVRLVEPDATVLRTEMSLTDEGWEIVAAMAE